MMKFFRLFIDRYLIPIINIYRLRLACKARIRGQISFLLAASESVRHNAAHTTRAT
jgi:hypothetical protein